MSHADTLRDLARDIPIGGMVAEHPNKTALLAGAEALDARDRVRAVLTYLRGQQEAALQRWDDTGDTWDGATSDTLHDTIHMLTEVLEGKTE